MEEKATSSMYSARSDREGIEFVDANTDKEHPLAGVVLCLTSVLPEQRVSAIGLSFSLR